MAEFMSVMMDWNRMCVSCPGCDGCPLKENCTLVPSVRDRKTVKQIEDTVAAWVKEHPLPMYPTWNEWFQSLGVGDMYTGEPIPADIAVMLRIKPKEG